MLYAAYAAFFSPHSNIGHIETHRKYSIFRIHRLVYKRCALYMSVFAPYIAKPLIHPPKVIEIFGGLYKLQPTNTYVNSKIWCFFVFYVSMW